MSNDMSVSGVDFKIVLLGSENVGKSTLMKRYVNNRYHDRPHQETIGAAYASKQVTSRGRQLIMGIWDTAGSERHRAISRHYYRDAKAAAVCFDLAERESFDQAKQWILELRNHEEKCKIYLCGTKKDIIDEGVMARAVSQEKVLQYARGMEAVYMETSSKTGENVAALFQKIADDCVVQPCQVADNKSIIVGTKHPKKTDSCC